LQFHYANGSTSDRAGDIYVNGSRVGSVSMPGTGGWSSWTTTSDSVNLSGGNNTIELRATTSGGLGNVDYLKVVGSDMSPGSCSDSGSSSSTSSSSSTGSSSSSTSSSSSSGSAVVLSQDGNPAQQRYNRSKTKWGTDKYDIVLSHQYDNGGWPKNQAYDSKGSGGNDKGTFDNNATVTEIVFMAQAYQETGSSKYRDSVRKAMDFILEAQYSSGGWPQFYPLRGGYSDHVTFNDNAMASVLTVLHNAHQKQAPFNGNIFDDSKRSEMKRAIDKGVDYILKSQWVQNGKLTVWCAQHGKDDYQPKAARAYELESLSGSESVEVIGFLMTQPQTAEIKKAVQAGIAWFRSSDTILKDYVYDKSTKEKIVYKQGGQMWYRFYDLYSNSGFFSDRDGGKYYNIMDISEERREGYSWGGNYGSKIISYANKVGY